MTLQPTVRALLDQWARRRWQDVDNAALTIARSLGAGSTPKEAAASVTRTMLDRNRISRDDVETAIREAEVQPTAVSKPLRLVVFTAVSLEYEAVATLLSNRESVQTGHGTIFESGTLDGDQPCEVLVAEIGPGNLGAAAEVTNAVNEFGPDGVMFVGVAGGLKSDTEIGDVVVATQVQYYESGRAEDEQFKARPITFPTSHRVEQLVRAAARQFDGTVHVKPIAAGEVLVASSSSEVASIINEHYNDAVAVDMESAGVYDAAHRLEIPCLAIRGVSDRLDDKSGAADAHRQERAATSAAAFMKLLVTAEDADTAFGRTNAS